MVIVTTKRHRDGARAHRLSSHDEKSIRPPVIASPTELPFRELRWERFERLCQDAARTQGFSDVQRYGKAGQVQHGVDFLGVSPEGCGTAFQVKQQENISAPELREMVRHFADGPLITRHDAFVVCMSVEANDKNFQDELHRLREQHVFDIHIWDAADITHFLRREENLVRVYFGPYWTKMIFVSRAVRNQAIWRSKNVPPGHNCAGKMSPDEGRGKESTSGAVGSGVEWELGEANQAESGSSADLSGATCLLCLRR